MKISTRILVTLCSLLFAASLVAQEAGDNDASDSVIQDQEPIEVADDGEAEIAPEDEEGDPESLSPGIAGNGAEAEPSATGPQEGQLSFTLQVHPIFTPDQAERVYRPLVNYLNARTPHHFELKLARDFHRYWAEIRREATPDLVLEDAHLTALRMQRQNYTPLVKAAEPATFSLLTSGMNLDARLTDFVGRPVSSMPAPSLGYLVLTSWYDNPMQQPVIQSNASSWLDAVEIVFSMEAEAAIVPHNLVERYVNMEVVRTSEEFPHATISASTNVPAEVQQTIIDALVVLHEDPEHFPALHELDIQQFIPASGSEYEGLERWLEQVFTFF